MSRLLLVAVASCAAAQQPHVPAFFWSSSALFSSTGGRESLREATGADVESTVGALIGSSSPIQGATAGAPLLAAAAGAKAPEVQLVFLADGLQTDAVRRHGAHLPAVNALLDGSKSSLSVPFTVPTGEKPFAAAAAVRMTGEEVEAYLKAHPTIFTNGVTDLLVIELTADADAEAIKVLAAHDVLIGRVARQVEMGTHGNYAAVLTGLPLARGARRLAVVAPPAYLHTTPTLLTAQLVMLLLFIIFMSGFCCLFSLQTPKKFEEVKQQ